MEPDAACYAAHSTLCTSHWYPPSIINKYVAGITHKQTRTWDCPQFPLQSDIKQPAVGFPIAAFWSALNGCHWGTRFSHLPPSARSHLSLSLIIHLIWRPSVWLIGTFPEFHLFLAVGMSASLLLVKKLALNSDFPPLLFVVDCILYDLTSAMISEFCDAHRFGANSINNTATNTWKCSECFGGTLTVLFLFFLVLESLNFWAPYRASISVNSPRNIESIRVTVCGSAHAFSAALYRYSECPVKWCILPNIANSNHSVRSRVVQSAWPASPCFTSQPTATKIYGAYRASSEHTQDTECCIFLQLHFIPLLSATHGTNGQ